jgi:hypothetical protein
MDIAVTNSVVCSLRRQSKEVQANFLFYINIYINIIFYIHIKKEVSLPHPVQGEMIA